MLPGRERVQAGTGSAGRDNKPGFGGWTGLWGGCGGSALGDRWQRNYRSAQRCSRTRHPAVREHILHWFCHHIVSDAWSGAPRPAT